MLIVTWKVKGRFIRFQQGMRTPLRSRLEAVHTTLWQKKKSSTFFPCLETLWKAEFNGTGLIAVTEGISRRPMFRLWHEYY